MTIVKTMNVRPVGPEHDIRRDPNGNEHAFRGEYREVVPSERLVYTF